MAILSQDQTRVCGQSPKPQQADPKLPPGRNFCKCPACGIYFGGVQTFEAHRVGPARDRGCLPPGEVRDKHNRPLLKLNLKGYWVRAYGKRAKLRAVA